MTSSKALLHNGIYTYVYFFRILKHYQNEIWSNSTVNRFLITKISNMFLAEW